MKNIIKIRNVLIRSTLVLALAGLASLSTAGFAQVKGATQLMQSKSRTAPEVKAVEARQSVAMSCPKCMDSLVTVAEKTGKAVQPEIQYQVLSHKCPGCANTTAIAGHGKAKTATLAHVCKEGGGKAASCCAVN